jgi:hypothetical protein
MVRVSERRRGTVLVHVVICMGVLMAVAAVALDGGLLLDQRRRLQVAADAAALAAAGDLYGNYLSNNGSDPKGTAKASALAVAAAHGYSNDGSSSVTVNIPPQTSAASGFPQPGYAEVIIQYNLKRGFSGIFGSGDVPVKARAVARGQWSPFSSAVVLLHPRATGALTLSGKASMNVIGGSVIVDSNDPQAVMITGSGALVAPPPLEFDVTGGTSGKIVGTVKTGVTATPNPFAYLPFPSSNSLLLRASATKQITGTSSATLSPGVYKGGISISDQANVTLQPGVYYLQGGGFSYTSSGVLMANGVLLFNAPVSEGDAINLAGKGVVVMSPLNSGLYQGFTIVQDPYSTLPVNVTGNGKMNITGTIYAAHASLNLTANGNGDVIGSQLVAYDLSLSGIGSIVVHRDINPAGRTRVIGLVE